jgi:formamidopyrimidine-DNA glycosylase
MPELPDVEGFRRHLEAGALHRTIQAVAVRSATILRGLSGAALARALRGRRMTRTRRHGKQLFIALDDGRWLSMHFGMTGSLRCFEGEEDDPPYDRLRLDLDDGHHLAYVSRRMLGGVAIETDPDAFIEREGLGPDALDPALDEQAFLARIDGRRGRIKALLMDQQVLAGIGNLYSDEILFQAGLHPLLAVASLEPLQRRRLYRCMRRVLQVAVKRGAGSEQGLEGLPAGYLLPRRREGARCPRCGAGLSTLKLAGRTAFYCPGCQPAAGR